MESRRKRKSSQIFKWVCYTLLMLLCTVLQTMPGLFQLGAAKPLYLLPLALAVSVFEGEFAGAVFGAVCGLMWDYTAGRTVGMLALELMILSFAVSAVVQLYLKDTAQNFLLIAAGCAVLVLACFFFQHSKATPVQPVESISPSSEIPASSAEVPAESSSTQPAVPVSTPDGLTFSLSAEMVSDKLSLELDYGTILFVVDPNASDITLQFDGFRTRYLTHSNKKEGTAEFSYHVPKYYALPDIDSAVLTITAPENILHKVDIDLAMGDVDLGTLSLEELDLELAMGDVSADSLTVKEADFNLAMGDCHIDHLTAPKFDAELAVGDCKIGMLSGAQDVSISVITGDTDLTLEGSASDYYLVTNGLTGTSSHDGKANASRKISLSSTTGDFSISYAN